MSGKNMEMRDSTRDPESEIVDLPREAPPPNAAAWTESPEVPVPEARAARARKRFGEGALIVCDNLVKIFKVADLEVVALQGIDLLVDPGEMIAIVGASGSGKSTLLNILGGLDIPSAGRATVAGHDLTQMGRTERTRYRRRTIGFVWQQTAKNLLPYLSAVENVEMPMILNRSGDRARALELLRMVGVEERADHRPDRLSGGEQQRVAFARAILSAPRLLLLDEPMSSLDSRLKKRLIPFLLRIRDEFRIPLIYVTHDAAELVALCDEVLMLERGRLIGRGSPADVLA